MIRSFSAAVLLASLLGAQTIYQVPGSYPTIQLAMTLAQNGDHVVVSPGVYSGPITFSGKALTVRSTGGPAATILLGNSSSRVVHFTNGETSGSILDGFTVTGGNGGIICQDSSPVIRNCVISGNLAQGTEPSGGGVLTDCSAGATCSPAFLDCSIVANICKDWGAGIFGRTENDTGVSNIAFFGCSISGNTSETLSLDGGGASFRALFGQSSLTATFVDCLVDGNGIFRSGGGVFASRIALLTMTSCRVTNNHAGDSGGGILARSTPTHLVNCLIARNSAAISEGGVATTGSLSGLVLDMRNCTVVENSAPIMPGVRTTSAVTLMLSSSILWGNGGLDLFWPGIGTVTHCNVGTGTPLSDPSNISAAPHFVNAGLSDYHLHASSPCVDSGDPGATGLPTTDLDDTPRIVGVVDMGADELPAFLFPGTNEDLDLVVWVNDAGDPQSSSRTAGPGDAITLETISPGGGFQGAAFGLLGQIHPTGSSVSTTPALPSVHLDLGLGFLQLLGNPGTIFPAAGLPPEGITLTTQVPPGLAGNSLRLQSFAVTPLAANGFYAATHAIEIDLQ